MRALVCPVELGGMYKLITSLVGEKRGAKPTTKSICYGTPDCENGLNVPNGKWVKLGCIALMSEQ